MKPYPISREIDGKRRFINGNEACLLRGEWRWADTGELIGDERRACPLCGKTPGPHGEDGCLGELPGVIGACCGHGKHNGYLVFENGLRIEFEMVGTPAWSTPSREVVK